METVKSTINTHNLDPELSVLLSCSLGEKKKQEKKNRISPKMQHKIQNGEAGPKVASSWLTKMSDALYVHACRCEGDTPQTKTIKKNIVHLTRGCGSRQFLFVAQLLTIWTQKA